MNIKGIIFSIFDIMLKVILVVIAVMFIIKGIRYAYDYGLEIFDQKPYSTTDTRTVEVTVSGSDGVVEVGKMLQEKKLIKDWRLFWIQERLSLYHDRIGAGTYELSPSMTPDEMIEIMTAATVEAKKNKEAAEANSAAVNTSEAGGADDADAPGVGEEGEEGEAAEGMGLPEGGEESAEDVMPPAEGDETG